MIEHEIEYFLDKKTIDYPDSIEFMEKKIEDIYKNNCKEFLWFLEHDNIYTAGTSAKQKDLINSNIDSIDEITVTAPGFINFVIDKKFYQDNLKLIIKNGVEFGKFFQMARLIF